MIKAISDVRMKSTLYVVKNEYGPDEDERHPGGLAMILVKVDRRPRPQNDYS